MIIPAPESGLVIKYSYLWLREARCGREEGAKDRPAVIVLAVEEAGAGPPRVTVSPITHAAPNAAGEAVEIPVSVRRHIGLDEAPCWIVVTEVNEFVWPGFDLRPIPGTDRCDYGFLPPRLLAKVQEAIAAWVAANRIGLVSRD